MTFKAYLHLKANEFLEGGDERVAEMIKAR